MVPQDKAKLTFPFILFFFFKCVILEHLSTKIGTCENVKVVDQGFLPCTQKSIAPISRLAELIHSI